MVEITPAAALLWELLTDFLRGWQGQRRGLFTNHIEPLQERIVLIHKDYTKGFEEIRRHLVQETAPPLALVEFLRERRRECECERELSRALARELRKIRKLGLSEDLQKAVAAYSRAVVRYFYASSRVGHSSWYSDFLDIVQHYIEEGREQVWEPAFIHGTPRLFVLDEVDSILDKYLPRAFERVADKYAAVRAQLL